MITNMLSLMQVEVYWQGFVKGLIIEEDDSLKCVDALWWYELRKQQGQWRANADITSFNASLISRSVINRSDHNEYSVLL